MKLWYISIIGSVIIKENSVYAYYFHKTDIKPRVLDGRNEIILANWPGDKYIVCNVNNDIQVKIPSSPYVLVKRGVLCNCGIGAENNFLFELLVAESNLVMYVTVNTAFVKCFVSLTETLQFPVLLNWTTHEQTLPISLQSFVFNLHLLKVPKTLKDVVHQFWHKKEIFDLQ